MNRKKMLLVAIVGLLSSLLLVTTTFAQAKPDQPAGNAEARTFTMNGKIIADNAGGYTLIRVKPHEEHKIVNVNEKILKNLATTGEMVTIEGRLPRGAYFLEIDKINGKAYPK
jgi:hypothetical protein